MNERNRGGRQKGRGHGDSSILCVTPHLSHGIWFVTAMESVTGSFLESWLQPVPGRRWPGSKAFLPLTDPQASMTNKLGFPCHNITFPNPWLTPRLSSLSAVSFSLHHLAMSSFLQGVTVALTSVTHTDVFPSLSFRLIVSAGFHFLASEYGCWYSKQKTLTAADTILPQTSPQNFKSPSPPPPYPIPHSLQNNFAAWSLLIYSVCLYWDTRDRLAILGMRNMASMSGII